ncbi:hypothetical protein [Cellulosimicrobium sp. Marseille-Q4280]|uniref:hypothetical protein n=1 Tax=Cellulosimicrobium sp. Marseille-Q4280 TaxID=2937992 RepID=UPI00203E5EAE|nr:hypothetical protein [Cellulosimicrobium sp. Marseille-Q4280]
MPIQTLAQTITVDPVRSAARRHAGVVAGSAAAAGVLTAMVVARATSVVDGLAEGVLLGLAPALVGAAFLSVHAVGERTWPRQSAAVRSATLRPRTVTDVAPAGLRRLTWALAAGILVLAAVGALTAGYDGRSVTRVAGDVTSTAGPYPGAFYGVWLALGAVLLLAGSEAVLRLVARRPAVATVSATWDVGLRRLSAHRVLRGVQLTLAATAAGMLFYGGTAAARVGYPGAVALAVVAVLLALGSLAVLVRAAPDPDAVTGHASREGAPAGA